MDSPATLVRAVGGTLAACALSGCGLLLPDLNVNVNVLDQRTQLENQVRGTYQELDQELLMVASVRGIDPSGKVVGRPALTPGKEEALRAVQSREFNRDDVESFFADGCAGEGRDGEVVYRACPSAESDARRKAFIESILTEENRDRVVLMHRVLATNADLAASDLEQVRRIFADLNRENAAPGSWIQTDEGRWLRKGSS